MTEHGLEDSNNEYKNRLIYAVTELSKLIVRGVEILPATISSEDAKNLFPDFNKLDQIESRIKLLDDKNK